MRRVESQKEFPSALKRTLAIALAVSQNSARSQPVSRDSVCQMNLSITFQIISFHNKIPDWRLYYNNALRYVL